MTAVFVFAEDCGACKQFKAKYWNDIKNNLKTPYIVINSPSVKSNLPTTVNGMRVPSNLQNYVQYFPTILLVNKADWDRGIVQPIVFDAEKEDFSPSGILNWIQRNSATVGVTRGLGSNFNYPRTVEKFYSKNENFRF